MERGTKCNSCLTYQSQHAQSAHLLTAPLVHLHHDVSGYTTNESNCYSTHNGQKNSQNLYNEVEKA